MGTCSPVDGYEKGWAGDEAGGWAAGASCGGAMGADAAADPAAAPSGGGGAEVCGGGTESPSMPQAYSDVIMVNHEW